MKRLQAIVTLLIFIAVISQSQNQHSTTQEIEQEMISVNDCFSIAEEEIIQLIAETKIELEAAVNHAIATERKYYEPILAGKAVLTTGYLSIIEQQEKKLEGFFWITVATGIAGGMISAFLFI